MSREASEHVPFSLPPSFLPSLSTSLSLSISLLLYQYINLANSDLGARAEDDAAGAMEDQINSQGEDGEQSRTAGGGAGQHTTGTRQPPGAISSVDLDTWTRARKPFKSRTPDQPRYKPGQGLTKVMGHTPTLGTPAAAAAQPTPKSAGSKRPTPDLP